MDGKEIFQVQALPGLDRDNTLWDAKHFTDGEWVRFQRGRPRKIGGFREVSENVATIIRGAFLTTRDQTVFTYGFGKNKCYLTRTSLSLSGSPSQETTLDAALSTDDKYTFQSDALFDATGGTDSTLMVHPATNLADISDQTNTKIYGATLGATPPVWVALNDGSGGTVSVSGGVCVLQPYVFAYGNNGLIKNSNENKPNDWRISATNNANEANVSATKVIKGLPMRGSGNSPAGLFWSLDSLTRVSFVGGSAGFRYDTLSNQVSVLSPHGIVEYDGVYYWIGTDRFLMYDGQVKEIPNQQNFNWFFDGVNFTQRMKVFAVKVPKYGEIWWFFPKDGATECSHAIILNVREKTWYDTRAKRSAGVQVQVAPNPMMYGHEANRLGTYSLFAHESGTDAIQGGVSTAIQSYVTTPDFGYPTGGASGDKPSGLDQWTRLVRVEPDVQNQEGDLTISTLGREFTSGSDTVTDYPMSPSSGKIDTRVHHRILRLKVESNTSGGDYQLGRLVVHTEPGDKRS